jgi:predicted nuclease with TOPRIM domain
MSIKYTKHFLNKLEDIMSETDYILRYEKGNFQSGYCILNDSKIAIINKFFALEGKINSLVEILRSIQFDTSKLSENNKKLYSEITQNQLQL